SSTTKSGINRVVRVHGSTLHPRCGRRCFPRFTYRVILQQASHRVFPPPALPTFRTRCDPELLASSWFSVETADAASFPDHRTNRVGKACRAGRLSGMAHAYGSLTWGRAARDAARRMDVETSRQLEQARRERFDQLTATHRNVLYRVAMRCCFRN